MSYSEYLTEYTDSQYISLDKMRWFYAQAESKAKFQPDVIRYGDEVHHVFYTEDYRRVRFILSDDSTLVMMDCQEWDGGTTWFGYHYSHTHRLVD